VRPSIAESSASSTESHLGYPGWKVVLAGFFGVMVSFAAVVPYTFGLFLKPLSLAFGWHRDDISAGFSIAALTLAAASPGLGFLLDRYKPRRIIVPCILVFSAAYASLAWLTPHLPRFYLTFFLIGLVGNGTAYIGYSRAISTWFNRRRGFALSIMLAGSALGAMLEIRIVESSMAGSSLLIKRTADPSAAPDFLLNLVASASFMRLSLLKGAHAALSSAVWQEIRVRSL
jgi:MFS family permease